MNKAFVKEGDDDLLSPLPEMPTGVRNYITRIGYQHMQTELRHMLDSLHSATLALADERSPDADLIEGSAEQNIREIEQRIHYLQTRLDMAEIVDPTVHAGEKQIFFGACVTYENERHESQTVTIVGLDELDPDKGKISWLSPVAQALLNAFEGDSVVLKIPAGDEKLHISTVLYPSLVEPDADATGLTNTGLE